MFQVQVYFGALDPDFIKVELHADDSGSGSFITEELNRGERLAGTANGFLYTARVPASRPASDYTPRLIPAHAGALVPLESPFILWDDSHSWK